VDPRHRDGLLAVAGLGVLLVGATVAVGTGPIIDPAAVVAGAAGALLVEALFLRYPRRLLARWQRRGVPTAGLLAVLAVGAVALRYAPRLVGALVWGLATYLALLGCVLAGFGNPLSRVVRAADAEE
jgi:hypothetical protein